MTERLIAPAASRDCLDLKSLFAFQGDNAGLTRLLKAELVRADQLLNERFWAGQPVTQLLAARAWVVEQLLLRAWHSLIPDSMSFSLVALGGFGRGELHPHSDIDLLILSDQDAPGEGSAGVLENLVTVLWDAGFYLGHSVRSVAQCAEDAGEDVQFATNLMESRCLAGPEAPYRALKQATSPAELWTGRAFFDAKYAEQKARHAQYHDTAYNLEPNIKEGPGGLRDIQMIAWVAKRHFRVNSLHGLVEIGFLTESLYQELISGREFLWRVRYALHCLAGRAEERLLFDFQRLIAGRFGYDIDSGDNQGVEQFMQRYFRTITALERLNERMLQLLEECFQNDKKNDKVVVLDDRFQIRDGYLEVISETCFLQRPESLLELFLVLQQQPEVRGLTAGTVRLIRQYLFLIDDKFRSDPNVHAAFLDLLRASNGVYTQLQRMNRYGVLARLLPAFEKIVGRMQFDLFHVYTVDQHILFVIRNLRRFAYGKYADRFPHGKKVFERIDKPELLYLAALFHDIAKGRDGDHSELGAIEARAFCQRLAIKPQDRRLVEWLVERHLLMSETAQRKDIHDPDTVTEFTRTVGDQRHLDYLYLLTMADISGTSPKLWNGWKDSLLWDLYLASSHALRLGLENPVDREQRIAETKQEAHKQLAMQGLPADSIDSLWRQLPEHAFLRLTVSQLTWSSQAVLEQTDRDQPLVEMRTDDRRGLTELLVHARDYNGLFATITLELERMGINVLAARVLTTLDGFSFDIFQLMDSHDQPLQAPDCARLTEKLLAQISQQKPGPPIRRRLSRRLQHFTGQPLVEFAPQPVQGQTLMELECSDRPGLLSSIAGVLLENDLQIHDARIATFGTWVEDTFLITDHKGRLLSGQQQTDLAESLLARLSDNRETAESA